MRYLSLVRGSLRHAVLIAAAAALAGCAGGEDGLKPTAEAMGLATTAQDPRPFVVQSRSPQADYIPVGTTGGRTTARRSIAEFEAMEKGLEARRLSNEARGAQAKRMGETAPPVTAPLPGD